MTRATTELTFVNRRSTIMEIWLEPWGDVLQVQPEKAFRLALAHNTNEPGSVFTIDCLQDGLRVWLERSGAASLSIFSDGVLIWQDGIRHA